MIPQAGEFGVETWEDDSWQYTGHSPVWSLFSGDTELGLVYMPDHGTDERHVRRSSARRQPFQPEHRVPSRPRRASACGTSKRCTTTSGTTIRRPHRSSWTSRSTAGRSRPSCCSRNRHSRTCSIDVTGEPVWPIVERPVPQSTVPGERTAPTQPIPDETAGVRSARRDRGEPHRLHAGAACGGARDPRSATRTARCSRRLRFATTRPAATSARFELPGSVGGPNWTGGAVDPETHILYVPSSTAPFVADIEPGDPTARTCGTSRASDSGVRRDRAACRCSSRRTAGSARST